MSLLLSMMTLITGFTCPPTIYFKFITKCDKCYYKVRQLFFITKCDGLLLQSATVFLLQSATSVITKCDNFITNCDRYYIVRQNIWLYVKVSFSPLFSLLLICPLITFPLFSPSLSNVIVVCFLDCKAVRIFAYSSTCKQSNKRSGTRLKPRARLGIELKIRIFPSPHFPYTGFWGSRTSRV